MVLALFLADMAFAHAQQPVWYVAHQFPEVMTLNGIDCRDSNNCLIIVDSTIGERPIIQKTTDGGMSWRTVWRWSPRVYPRPIPRLTSIRWVTDSLALASADSGQIIRSTDGGETWSSRVFADTASEPTGLRMIDSLHGIIHLDLVPEPRVFITDDGGITWASFNVPDPVGYDVTRWVWSNVRPFRLTPSSYLCIKEGRGNFREARLLRTTNSGATWDTIRTPFPGWEQFNPSGFAMRFDDSLIGWATIRLTLTDSTPDWNWLVSRTTDGGSTWRVVFADTLNNRHNGPIVLWGGDSLQVVLAADRSLARTTDGCRTWTFDSSTTSPQVFPLFTPSVRSSNPPIIGVPAFARNRLLRYGIPPVSAVVESRSGGTGIIRKAQSVYLDDVRIIGDILRIKVRSTSIAVSSCVFMVQNIHNDRTNRTHLVESLNYTLS